MNRDKTSLETPLLSFGVVSDLHVRRLLTVVTPRTCGGFAFPESGRVESGPLAFTLSGSRATVCATSVDPDMRPLTTARRILVMHLTDLQSEGSAFADETFQTTLKKGVAPLVADGTATDGRRLEGIPCRVENDTLSFTATVRGSDGKARLYYEITRP